MTDKGEKITKIKRKYNKSTTKQSLLNNNYSPKWRWLVVDIYRTAKQ